MLEDFKKFNMNGKLRKFIFKFKYSAPQEPKKAKHIKDALKCFLMINYDISMIQS